MDRYPPTRMTWWNGASGSRPRSRIRAVRHSGLRRLRLHILFWKVARRAPAAHDDVGHPLDRLVQWNTVARLDRCSTAAIQLIERNPYVREVLYEIGHLG